MRLELGVAYDLPPIPPARERMRLFSGGGVAFGVEYRVLDAETIARTFTPQERATSQIEAVKDGAEVRDNGVSIHVFEDEDASRERLRFDCFDEDPHYHYVVPGASNLAIAFDPDANGDMLDWTLSRLRTRLPQMLRKAGAEDAADRVDQVAVAAVLDQVEAEARRVRYAGLQA